jgi:hypothetical protein
MAMQAQRACVARATVQWRAVMVTGRWPARERMAGAQAHPAAGGSRCLMVVNECGGWRRAAPTHSTAQKGRRVPATRQRELNHGSGVNVLSTLAQPQPKVQPEGNFPAPVPIPP